MRRSLFLLTLAVVVFLYGQSPSVLGYALEGQKWSNGTITMNLQLSSGVVPYPDQPSLGNQPGLQDGSATWNAVAQAALGDWNQYLVNVQFNSNTTTLAPKNGDGINTVFFSSTAFGQSFGSDTLAVTIRLFTPSTNLNTEADVVVNTAFQWDAYRGDLQSGGNDIRRVLDHEFGHVLGLDHPDQATPPQTVIAIMNSVIGGLDHIEQDDINGVMSLYGQKTILANVTGTADPADGGVVLGGGTYPIGTTRQLTATAAPGYTFIDWNDGNTNISRPIIVPVQGGTYTATFGSPLQTWTQQNSPRGLEQLFYINNTFMALGDGKLLTSSDGIAWTTHTPVTQVNYDSDSVAYGNGTFVSVGFENIWTSSDGLNWTVNTTTNLNDYEFSSITYGNGLFVAVGSGFFFGGQSLVMTSPDGITWTLQTNGVTTADFSTITYGNGKFVALGVWNEQGIAITSADGITWTSATLASTSQFSRVTYGVGIFLATSSMDGTVSTSTDGLNWTQGPTLGPYYAQTIYGDGMFLAWTSNLLYSSTDGINWTPINLVNGFFPVEAPESFGNGPAALYADGRFVALDGFGGIYSSGAVGAILPSQTIDFPAIGTRAETDAPFAISATASSGLPVTLSVVDGPATLSSNTITLTGAGTVVIQAYQAGDGSHAPEAAFQSFEVNALPGSVSLSGLNVIYDGTAKAVTTTTTPPGLSVSVTYNGSTSPPSAIGSYTVTATVTDPSYNGTVTGTLVINPIPVTVTLGALNFTYNRLAHATTATTNPAKFPVIITYNGSLTAPVLAGSYTVFARVNKPNYGGSESGTLTIAPILPLVATVGSSAASSSSEIFKGAANPETSDTQVYFQYGTDTSYGSTTSPQDAGSGSTAFNFSDGTDLQLQTTPVTYHYRAVASNAAGMVYGADKTFVTPAIPGLVTNPQAAVSASGVEFVTNVNPDGIAMSVYFELSSDLVIGLTPWQNVGSSRVPINVFTFLTGLTPNTTYHFHVVVVSNGGAISGPDQTFTTPPYDTALVVQKGEAAGGTSSTFASFGPAAVNVSDTVAFAATLTLGSGITAANDFGIWTDDDLGNQTLIAQLGSAAPGTPSTFATLSDPAFNDNGVVAFRGTLKALAGQVTAANYIGLWSTESGTPQLLARQGSSAPGTTGTFASFTTFGLTQSGNTIFSGALNAGTGITAANYTGIWEGDTAADLTLQLRLGENVGSKVITAYTFLPAELYVNGQTRSFNDSGDLACHVTFAGGTGLVEVIGGVPQLALTSGSVATGAGSATYALFGNPSINDNDRIAYAATLTPGVGGITTLTNLSVWADDNTGTRQLIAQSGIAGKAPLPTGTGTFTSFSDPVYNNNEAAAFRATLKVVAGQAAATSATGIWATTGSAGSLALVAQQGVTPAPGCPAGATFSAFTELALADQGGAGNTGGAIFMATLNASAIAGVNATNYIGIWAVDSTGALQLIARTGDVINVVANPELAPIYKTVTALALLPGPLYVNGTSRSFDQANGDLVYQATFSDKSTAILNVEF